MRARTAAMPGSAHQAGTPWRLPRRSEERRLGRPPVAEEGTVAAVVAGSLVAFGVRLVIAAGSPCPDAPWRVGPAGRPAPPGSGQLPESQAWSMDFRTSSTDIWPVSRPVTPVPRAL